MHHTSFLAAAAWASSLSREDRLPENELKAVLRGAKKPAPQWLPHFAALFAEVPHAYLAGLMQELNLAPKDMERACNLLPSGLQRRPFKEFRKSLDEMKMKPQSGRLRLGRQEDGRWVWLLHLALQQLERAGIPSGSWILGGGMGVSLALDHRESSDVDIVFRDPRLLEQLSACVREDDMDDDAEVQRQPRSLRLSWYEGEVHFLVADPLTDLAPGSYTVAGETFLVDDPVEILAQKIVSRTNDFEDADFFDLVCAWSCQPERFLARARTFSPCLVPLANHIRLLRRRIRLEKLDLRPNGMRLCSREFDVFQAFYEAMVERLTNSRPDSLPYRWWCFAEQSKEAGRQAVQTAKDLFRTFTRW